MTNINLLYEYPLYIVFFKKPEVKDSSLMQNAIQPIYKPLKLNHIRGEKR